MPDHNAYNPGACDLRIRVIRDRQTGRLLGAPDASASAVTIRSIATSTLAESRDRNQM